MKGQEECRESVAMRDGQLVRLHRRAGCMEEMSYTRQAKRALGSGEELGCFGLRDGRTDQALT